MTKESSSFIPASFCSSNRIITATAIAVFSFQSSSFIFEPDTRPDQTRHPIPSGSPFEVNLQPDIIFCYSMPHSHPHQSSRPRALLVWFQFCPLLSFILIIKMLSISIHKYFMGKIWKGKANLFCKVTLTIIIIIINFNPFITNIPLTILNLRKVFGLSHKSIIHTPGKYNNHIISCRLLKIIPKPSQNQKKNPIKRRRQDGNNQSNLVLTNGALGLLFESLGGLASFGLAWCDIMIQTEFHE